MLRIRTLWLFGLAGLLGAAGCVIHDPDEAAFVVTWELEYVGSDEAVACARAKTPTVTLQMRNLGTGQVLRNTFDCQRGGGQSEILPAGDYAVVISLDGEDGRALSAKEGEFRVFRRGLTDLQHIVFQVQSFRLAWSIARGGAATTCRAVDGRTVKLITQTVEGAPTSYSFPCEDGSAQTPAVPSGSYSVQVQLVGGGGQVISQTDPMTFVAGTDRRADLPPITFRVQ
jgi:hypothetical protein